MAKKLYVGNLSFEVTEETLSNLFTEFGTIVSANLITDRQSGRSKGFGFVEMETDEAAQAAIDKLHETEQDGRNIIVSEARPREERPGGGGKNNRRF